MFCSVYIIWPIPRGHSGPLCHALSWLSLLSMLLWTSMRRRRATVATPGKWRAADRSCEWAQHFSNASCCILFVLPFGVINDNKLKFHEAVFFVASSRHLREDVRNRSCVLCSWTCGEPKRHTDKRAALYRTNRRPTNQLSAWQAGRGSRPDTHDLLRTFSRGCYAENGPVEFKLN